MRLPRIVNHPAPQGGARGRLSELDWAAVAWAAVSLFAGGAVKGVVGLGLPLVAMPLLTLSLTLKESVGLLVLPMVASNLVQSFQGGLFLATLRRFWLLLLVLLVTVALATKLLVIIRQEVLFVVIGTSLIVFPLLAYFRPSLRISAAAERWVGPLVGLVAGVIGGVSTFYGAPLMLYLVWLRLPKDLFVVAVSLMYFVGAVGLTLGLTIFGVMEPSGLGLSALGCVPVFVGLWLGQRLRVRLDEKLFARILLAVYLATGTTFLAKGL
jgi:uncharacterized membrane protein YfcA